MPRIVCRQPTPATLPLLPATLVSRNRAVKRRLWAALGCIIAYSDDDARGKKLPNGNLQGVEMDLTSLIAVIFLGIGVIGAESVIHFDSIVVDVTPAPPMAGQQIDHATLEAEFADQLYEIARTPSVIEPPAIRASKDQGIGIALAKAINIEEIVYATQAALGYAPDRLRLALYLEGGELHGQVSGTTRRIGSFRHVIVPHPNETLLHFVRRCALWGASEAAPYDTALYLMQKHSSDRDFTDAVALIDHAKSVLPPTPISFDRAAFDNLQGIVLLFQNKAAEAQEAFDRAVEEWPDSPVSELNAAFADLQLDKYPQGADRMRRLIGERPPGNKVLLGTAYVTWAAAEMGMRHFDAADQLLAKAIAVNPDTSSGYDLWSELKRQMHDDEAAARYHRQALLNSPLFENYGEVAALYFHLSWHDNEPVLLNQFRNPDVVSFH
jgi:tetratricopeptide (TPR) repeat protein